MEENPRKVQKLSHFIFISHSDLRLCLWISSLHKCLKQTHVLFLNVLPHYISPTPTDWSNQSNYMDSDSLTGEMLSERTGRFCWRSCLLSAVVVRQELIYGKLQVAPRCLRMSKQRPKWYSKPFFSCYYKVNGSTLSMQMSNFPCHAVKPFNQWVRTCAFKVYSNLTLVLKHWH